MGLVSDEQRGIMSDFLAHDFEEIESKLRPNTSGASHFLADGYLFLIAGHGLIKQLSLSCIFGLQVCIFDYPHFSIHPSLKTITRT